MQCCGWESRSSHVKIGKGQEVWWVDGGIFRGHPPGDAARFGK